MLTKSVAASSGRVLLDGSDELSVPLGTSAGRIGFCPQTDPLIGMLSAREQIAMFARLKASHHHYSIKMTALIGAYHLELSDLVHF